ncbi:MAG: cupin domain-containing protein [bacterium]|nr:cupin domain-containing protein [bacterium]
MNEQKKVIRLFLSDKRIEQKERGWLIQLMPILKEYISPIEDIHIVSLEPNTIRGNHYHQETTEIIFPLFGRITVAWKEEELLFKENPLPATTLYVIPPNVPHALRNDGLVAAIAIAFGSKSYDPIHPDRVKEEIILPNL